jgi:hypothetical protein
MGRPSRNAGAQNGPELDGEDHGPSIEKLVELIIRQLDSPARVMELYYWSREPQLLDIIRSIIAMPEQTREKLEAFMSMAGSPETIAATLDNSGRLTLTSAHVTDALDLMREDRAAMVPEIIHRTH